MREKQQIKGISHVLLFYLRKVGRLSLLHVVGLNIGEHGRVRVVCGATSNSLRLAGVEEDQ